MALAGLICPHCNSPSGILGCWENFMRTAPCNNCQEKVYVNGEEYIDDYCFLLEEG